MLNRQAQSTYLRTQVTTAAPWELTTLLFNGCIKLMKQAQDAIENKNYEMKNLYIKKAQDILDELLITLNYEYEISKQLASLYRYMKEHLMSANINMDVYKVAEVIDLMTELKDSWVEAMKSIHIKPKVNL